MDLSVFHQLVHITRSRQVLRAVKGWFVFWMLIPEVGELWLFALSTAPVVHRGSWNELDKGCSLELQISRVISLLLV